MISLNAWVSLSTRSNNLFWQAIPLWPHLEKNSHLSSHPLLCADKFATIVARADPKTPQYAAIDPPPGAGDSLEVSLAKSLIDIFAKGLFFVSIKYSIILSLGLNSDNSSRPRDLIAMCIICLSGIAKDLFCFFKKYFPASINTFFGTSPISSDPVTRSPLIWALSHVLSNTSCNGVVFILVKLYEICAIPYSSIYQPIPLRFLKQPGSRRIFPFLSFKTFPFNLPPSLLILPASLKSKAMELALLVDVVLIFTLYAIKKSLAAIAVAPDFFIDKLYLLGP